MRHIASTIGALADPTRRSIYERISRRPRSVNELRRGLAVSQPAVSQHLRTLREAGLVSARAEGTRRIYYANPAGLETLRRYVDSLWDDALAAFARHIEKGAPSDHNRKSEEP